MKVLTYSWLDYLLFCLMYIISVAIGLYYGCFGNKQSTTNEYLYGGKNMGVIPVGMSMIAGAISGTVLLGVSAEVYMNGIQIMISVFSELITGIVIYYVYLPVFYKLQLTSTYDYMLLRFDKRVKILSFVLFVISAFLFLPISIYAAALSFNQVTGFNLHYILITMSIICIFYTTIGGLKSVIWTDTLQFIITLGILIFLFIYGVSSVGGFQVIWERAKAGDRMGIFNMDPDPTVRASFWSVIIGQVLTTFSLHGINPSAVQRFLAISTLKRAKRTLIFNTIGIMFVFSLCCLFGLVAYAKYHDCDPLAAKQIQKPDQILSYFVMDVAGKIPGICGLFLAGMFSTSLTTLSTFLNTLSGLIYVDCIVPFLSKPPSDRDASNIMKFIAALVGVTIIGLAFAVEKLGAIHEIWVSLNGISAGPLIGIFTLGIFFPFANSKGALGGGIFSIIFMSWIIIKAKLLMFSGELKYYPKPLYTYGCKNLTLAFNETAAATSLSAISCPREDTFSLYKISFHYHIALGTLVTIVVGLIISWISGFNKHPVDLDLICPFLHKFLSKSSKMGTYQSVEKDLPKEEDELQHKFNSSLIN